MRHHLREERVLWLGDQVRRSPPGKRRSSPRCPSIVNWCTLRDPPPCIPDPVSAHKGSATSCNRRQLRRRKAPVRSKGARALRSHRQGIRANLRDKGQRKRRSRHESIERGRCRLLLLLLLHCCCAAPALFVYDIDFSGCCQLVRRSLVYCQPRA